MRTLGSLLGHTEGVGSGAVCSTDTCGLGLASRTRTGLNRVLRFDAVITQQLGSGGWGGGGGAHRFYNTSESIH